MELKIINEKNFPKEDFWLHRYFSACYLPKVLTGNTLQIRFSRITQFRDNLEGWDLSNPQFKLGMDVLSRWHKAVIEEGASVENITLYFEDYLQQGVSVNDAIAQLAEFDKERKRSFASCWFADKSLTESRPMWEIYGNKAKSCLQEGKQDCELCKVMPAIKPPPNPLKGVMIAVKWSDLKPLLEKKGDEIQAGFVDYDNKGIVPPMFTKDASYKHEREFRLLIVKEDQKENSLNIDIENIPVTCVLWKGQDTQIIEKYLEEIGFQPYKPEDIDKKQRYYKDSTLVPEGPGPQEDWDGLLAQLDKEKQLYKNNV